MNNEFMVMDEEELLDVDGGAVFLHRMRFMLHLEKIMQMRLRDMRQCLAA